MKHIYLIVENVTETLGHGHYGDMYKIATYCVDTKTDQLYPAFKTEKAAKKYWIEKQIEFWKNCRPDMSKSEVNNIILTCKPEILKLPIN